MKRYRKWLVAAAAALALLLAANTTLSLLVGSRRVSRLLTSRLAAAFGRPVEVGRFAFSLWEGPEIEADSVTVAEDPRFGHEYFLRADQVTATLRWGSLLRGRFDFGSFSLSHASLNLVAVGGRWNLGDWLPPVSAGASGGRSEVPRLYRIEIDGGRINFKRGTEKLPFALVDVNGSVDESAPGRWSLSLEAQPMRAAVTLQDVGTLRLVGQVGGTSARLRPANLDLRWEDASVSDVMRLFFGYDYGVRGGQNLELRASSTGKQWKFELDARATNLHRWDLVAEPGNPGVNLRIAGAWSPGEGDLTLTGGQIEGPESFVALTGGLNWPVAGFSGASTGQSVPQFHLHLTSAGIGAQDVLSWYRSFHHAIPASLRASGWLQGSADFDGWPPRLHDLAVSALGLRAQGGALAHPVQLASADLKLARQTATLSLTGLDFGTGIGRFRIAGRARRNRRWDYRLEATGSSPQIGDLLGAVEALGARAPAYWREFSGGATIRIDWSGTLPSSARSVSARVALHDAVWKDPLLPAHVRFEDATVEAENDILRFDVRRAESMGGLWHGWLERRRSSGAWRFRLVADRLDARTLVARLRPQQQSPSLLDRIFGLGHEAGSPPLWPASLQASGTLDLARLSLAPVDVDRLNGQVTIHDGTLDISSARATFYGGRADGSLSFSVAKGVPVWRLGTRVEGVDLERLSRAVQDTQDRFSGRVSGSLQLSARGATAGSLLGSLGGQAQLAVRGARDANIDWLATLEAGHAIHGRSSFASCTASIQLAKGKLSFQNLSIGARNGRLEATGGIDLARGGALTVQARFLPRSGSAQPGSTLEAHTYQVTGSPTEPRVRLQPPAEAPPSRSDAADPRF